MKLRTIAIVVVLLNAAICAAVVLATVLSGSDAATRGLDQAAGWFVTALFLVTGAPALALASMNRAPVTTLILGLAFPIVLIVAFVASVIAFA